MVGYGTTVRVPVGRDELMKRLMAAAQRRAETTFLDFSYGAKHAGEFTDWEMVVDGHGFRVAAWSHQLERDLPTVAEGYEGLPTPTAVGFAKALVGRWFEDCIGTSQAVEDDDLPAVVSDDGQNEWWWPILATEFDGLADESKRRLQQADDLVGRWVVGELPVETIIEEVHTIAEAVLRSATGLGRGSNWPSLVEKASAQRIITADDSRILRRFSTMYRNRLKHEAGMLGDESDPEALVGDVILVLDHVERFAKAPLTDVAASELDALRGKAEELMGKAYTEAGLPPPTPQYQTHTALGPDAPPSTAPLRQATPKTIRYRLLHIAAHTTPTSQRLRFDATWPWTNDLITAIQRAKTRLRPLTAALTPAIHPGL